MFTDTPGLTTLGYYGGPTQTLALLPTSPAIGHGNAAAPGLPATDQRGFPRLTTGRLDIGAFQTQANPFQVTTAANPGQVPGLLSLREAINLINAYPPSISPASITFAIGTPGSVQTINLLSALPAVGSPVTINAFSQGGANYAGTPLIVLDGASITGGNGSLRGLDLEGGNSQVKGLDIGGFAGDGIYLGAGGYGGDDSIVSNVIGTQSLGNEVGIEVAGANNPIGAAGAGNVIAFNSLEGILVNGGTDNAIHQNSIFSNGPQQLGPGILLEAGGNDNQARRPFPVPPPMPT